MHFNLLPMSVCRKKTPRPMHKCGNGTEIDRGWNTDPIEGENADGRQGSRKCIRSTDRSGRCDAGPERITRKPDSFFLGEWRVEGKKRGTCLDVHYAATATITKKIKPGVFEGRFQETEKNQPRADASILCKVTGNDKNWKHQFAGILELRVEGSASVAFHFPDRPYKKPITHVVKDGALAQQNTGRWAQLTWRKSGAGTAKPRLASKPLGESAKKATARQYREPPFAETLRKSFGEAPPDRIRHIQKMLTRLGYEPGTADGVAGAKTVAASEQFWRGTKRNFGPDWAALYANLSRAMAARGLSLDASKTASSGWGCEGQRKAGKLHGRGTCRWANGYRYEGEWRDGKRQGKGVLYFPNGDRYVGGFKNNQFNGQGTHYRSDGSIYFTGAWRENKKHGHGRQFFPGGSSYEGVFRDGVRHGEGIWYSGNKKIQRVRYEDNKQVFAEAIDESPSKHASSSSSSSSPSGRGRSSAPDPGLAVLGSILGSVLGVARANRDAKRQQPARLIVSRHKRHHTGVTRRHRPRDRHTFQRQGRTTVSRANQPRNL